MEFFVNFDSSSISNILSQASQNELVRYGFFFALAAWIHAGRVKKEIKLNFVALTSAIQELGGALRADLESHRKILAEHGQRLDTLEVNRKRARETPPPI